MKNYLLTTLFAVWTISAIAVSGCIALKSGGSGRFDHKAHSVAGIRCAACHISVLKTEKADMPKEHKCVYCHPTVYDGKAVEEIYTLDKWQSERGRELVIFNDVKFSHKGHMDSGKQCSDCHADVGESRVVNAEHLPNANTCVQCHSKWLNESQCARCHKKARLETPPEDHKMTDFMYAHGKKLTDGPFDNWAEGTGRHSHQCFRCHNQGHCIKCHNEVAPRNHTNEWRTIGHGITAGIDRNGCKSCHKVDFCLRCHDRMRPRSHGADWGATRSMHCAYCHEPLSSSRCSVCHKSAHSHETAPNAPDFVGEGSRCRACHYTIVPLDHFDNGEDCQNCHRITESPARQSRRNRRWQGGLWRRRNDKP